MLTIFKHKYLIVTLKRVFCLSYGMLASANTMGLLLINCALHMFHNQLQDGTTLLPFNAS